ncbi:copper-binding protein [Ramlibacter sp. PS3R-8]|uniref:copper-binding protein n=1 Tax=Ramlibacter sp. PS3R-8 TaxID=3133437 RepID=UPI00309A3BB0
MTAALAMPSLAQSTMTDAEVRKVDKESKKITLKHGEIKNLDMPPMTMVFNVSDPSMLDKVQAGDKIRFSATNDGGKFTVTEIQPVK